MSDTCKDCAEVETADGIHLCHTCTEKLEYAIAELSTAQEELQTTIARLDNTGGGGGNSSIHAPSPINVEAMAIKDRINEYLASVCKQLGKPVTGPGTVTDYLMRTIPLLRRQEWVGAMRGDLARFTVEALRSMDSKGDRITVGECGYDDGNVTCTNPLTPYAEDRIYQCKVCGTTWDVKERQRDAIGAAWNVADYPPVIIRALAEYGFKITTKSFENWVARGHLIPVSELAGRKQYKVHEVWAVARYMEAKKKTA